MTKRIGITGHQVLPAGSTSWLQQEIRRLLTAAGEVCGLSSLAAGADQLFADCVLDGGGTLHAIIPFAGYELVFTDATARANFERLVSRAAQVTTLERLPSLQASYLAGGARVVSECHLLVAVWNGLPAAGLGGTGDVVKIAIQAGRPIVHLDPFTRTCTDIGPS